MNLILLLIIPAFLATFALFVHERRQRIFRRRLLLLGSVSHMIGTGLFYVPGVCRHFTRYLSVDLLSLMYLTLTSFLFFLVTIYSFGYFFKESLAENESGTRHLYTPCMLFFLSAMTLAILTPHLGLLWVAVEATTLATAPLIYYHRHARSLEAAWKYLLMCSMGIALALLGIFFIAAAGKGSGLDLFVYDFVRNAQVLDVRWLKIGFLCVFVGYGTKMGLAPLHNWLPDAHAESPSPVSALLSGTLLNIAFLGILRCYQICVAAGLAAYCQKLFLIFGLLSLGVAMVFIADQKDYKRLLAYSSVEHMGILSLGMGVGVPFASFLHMINHSLTKGLLFLSAGHIVQVYQSKKIADVQGLLKTIPVTGVLFLMGSLAIMGLPPFSIFVSKFLILEGSFSNGHPLIAAFYLLFLGVIFAAMSKLILGMVQGEQRQFPGTAERLPTLIIPPLILAGVILMLGVYIPAPVVDFLHQVALIFQGGGG